MTSFDPVYRALAYIGYSDPLHPPFTHYPIALVTASLFFGLVAWLWRRPAFWVTARHCLVLAWLFIFPTVLFGYMDWQHYYHGVWMGPIIVKICLASFLFALLSIGLILVYKGRSDSRAILVIYAIGFITVVGLGYFGGKIVYEGIGREGPAVGVSLQVKAGEGIFEKNCQSCHPNGGNAIMPNMPIRGSDKLANFRTFVDFIRQPRLPSGANGPMPNFHYTKLSDQEAKALYGYVNHAFGDIGKP